MDRGAPPARSGVKSKFAIFCAAFVALGLWACTDQPADPTNTDGLLAFDGGGGGHDDDDDGHDDDDDDHGDRRKGPVVTGSIRTDFPDGGPNRNPNSSGMFQEWSMHLRDNNRDGWPDQGSKIQVTDYREQFRDSKNKPMRLVSVGFVSQFRPIMAETGCDPNLDPQCCPRGGVEVQGYFDIKNTPQYDNKEFLVRACDVSKHGTRKKNPENFDNDRIWLQVIGVPDPTFGKPCYQIFHVPDGFMYPAAFGAFVTAGNLTVDNRTVTAPVPLSDWQDCTGSPTT